MCLKENNLNLHVCPILFIIILSSPFSLFSLSSLSLSELLGDLLNGASSTPVSTTMVVGRDLFFGEWMDKVNIGGGDVGAVARHGRVCVQSVIITLPFCSVSLNACALAAQRNSGRIGRNHSTLTTTNHLKVVAGNYATIR